METGVVVGAQEVERAFAVVMGTAGLLLGFGVKGEASLAAGFGIIPGGALGGRPGHLQGGVSGLGGVAAATVSAGGVPLPPAFLHRGLGVHRDRG